jgi:asparagine synthetase B (glutamine-hydrolysing)
MTAEYSFARYSELEAAKRTARTLGMEHHAVKVGYTEHRQALLRMNGEAMDVPATHSQLSSLVALGDAAIALGLPAWFTGDNSGPLFLEFDHFFRGLPSDSAGFQAAASRMSLAEYQARKGRFGTLTNDGRALLACFGLPPEGCEAWLEQRDADQASSDRLFEALGYPLATQAYGQTWTGVVHQNCWLPAQEAVGHHGQVLSPFLDIEMIRFALSLPLHLKYRDGVSKWFLKEFLRRETGLVPGKLASPDPSRVWWLIPRPDDAFRVDPRIRSLLLQWQAENILDIGRRHNRLRSLTSLGLWLATHELQQP